jgi:hypothetical protein
LESCLDVVPVVVLLPQINDILESQLPHHIIHSDHLATDSVDDLPFMESLSVLDELRRRRFAGGASRDAHESHPQQDRTSVKPIEETTSFRLTLSHRPYLTQLPGTGKQTTLTL